MRRLWYEFCCISPCIKGMFLIAAVILLAALIAYQLDPTFYR